MNRPFSQLIASLALLPVVTLLAVGSWADGQADPTAAAEGRYLSLVAAWGMACAAALVPRTGGAVLGLASAMMLVVTAVWAVPGPTRGPVVMVLVLITVAGAANGKLRRLDEGAPLPLPVALALALAAQVFFRGDRFLIQGPGAGELATLFLLPGLGALALWILSRQYGAAAALVAGGVVVVATPGWTALSALVLLGLAAGRDLVEARRPLPPLAAVVVLLSTAAALGGRIEAALVGLGMLLLAALERAGRGWFAWQMVVVGGSAVLLFALGQPIRGAAEVAGGLLLFFFLMPSLIPLLGISVGHKRILVAVPMAALGLLFLPGTAGLLPAAALLSVGSTGTERSGGLPAVARSLQEGWTVGLVAVTALLAGYPWLRPTPLATLVPLGPPLGWLLPAFLLGAVVLLLWLAGRTRSPAGRRVLFACLGGVLVLPLIRSVGVLELQGEVLTLTAKHPEWSAPCSEDDWRGVGWKASRRFLVIDSSVSNSVGLPAGTVVMTVERTPQDESSSPRPPWDLRLAVDTGEWSVRRPGVEAAAPEAWVSNVAPEGRFFAQRYRARLELAPRGCREVKIRRNADLPTAVSLNLFRIEVQRE